MEKVCRLCLRSPKELLPLLDEFLVYKIETISSIQLIIGDQYPSTICQECTLNVNKFYNFRRVIINSDKELRHCSIALERSIKQPQQTDIIIHQNDVIVDKITSDEENDITYIHLDDVLSVKNEHIIIRSGDDNINSDDEKQQQNDFNTGTEDHDSGSSNISNEIPITDNQELSKIINPSLLQTLNEIKSIKCKICAKIFTSRYKLYNHRRTVHTNRGVCSICGMTVRVDNLRRHVLLHSENPTDCRQCGKTFKNSESLRCHMLIHRGTVFTCEICGKQSKVKTEHRRHMKSHTDPNHRKVICRLCGKRVRDLRTHMHSHTGERPFVCSYCQKGFTSPYALKVHTRQHTNEKPYVCEYCPMAFPQKISLLTHLKSKHGHN